MGDAQVHDGSATSSRRLRDGSGRWRQSLCASRWSRSGTAWRARSSSCAWRSATAVAERWSVPISATTDLTVYLLPTVFAAVVFGPLAAGVIAAASMLGDPELFRRGDPRRAPRLKWANYTAASFITGAVAGLTAQALTGDSIGAIVAATFAAMAAAEASDFFFAVMTSQVRRRSMHELANRIGPVALTSFLVYAPVVVVLVVAYTRVSPISILLFVVPTLAFQRLYALYQRERTLGDELRTANETLARGQPVVRGRPRHGSRGERRLHGRSLPRGRHLLPRHRPANGPSARRVRPSVPLRPCARHRQGRTSAQSSRQGRPADA